MGKEKDKISLPTKMSETDICVAPNEALGTGPNVQWGERKNTVTVSVVTLIPLLK